MECGCAVVGDYVVQVEAPASFLISQPLVLR
jgi:hypothetical protein